jgi:hypothetical protein
MPGGLSGLLRWWVALVSLKDAASRSQGVDPRPKVRRIVYRRQIHPSKEQSARCPWRMMVCIGSMLLSRSREQQRQSVPLMVGEAWPQKVRTSVRRFCCRTFLPRPVISICRSIGMEAWFAIQDFKASGLGLNSARQRDGHRDRRTRKRISSLPADVDHCVRDISATTCLCRRNTFGKVTSQASPDEA